mgnify:CR=1 FL=1
MTIYYSLRIEVGEELYSFINTLLGVKSNSSSIWEIQFIQQEHDIYISYIDYFLSILEGKYRLLDTIGVTREDISIWILYEYENQCNLEFSPTELTKIGVQGITLCISCWEEDSLSTL